MRHSCCVNACCVRGEIFALPLAFRFSSSAQTAPTLTVPSLVLLLRSGFELVPSAAACHCSHSAPYSWSAPQDTPRSASCGPCKVQTPALPAPSPPAVSCPLDPLCAGKAAISRYPKPLNGTRSNLPQPCGVVPVSTVWSYMYSRSSTTPVNSALGCAVLRAARASRGLAVVDQRGLARITLQSASMRQKRKFKFLADKARWSFIYLFSFSWPHFKM